MSDQAVGRCVLRDRKPRAVFIWEAEQPTVESTPGGPRTLDVAALLNAGFTLSLGTPLESIAPQATDWFVELGKESQIFVVHVPSDTQFFAGSLPSPPPGWLDAAHDDRCVYLISGAGLDLDGPGAAETLDAAASAGRVATAVVGLAHRDSGDGTLTSRPPTS